MSTWMIPRFNGLSDTSFGDRGHRNGGCDDDDGVEGGSHHQVNATEGNVVGHMWDRGDHDTSGCEEVHVVMADVTISSRSFTRPQWGSVHNKVDEELNSAYEKVVGIADVKAPLMAGEK